MLDHLAQAVRFLIDRLQRFDKGFLVPARPILQQPARRGFDGGERGPQFMRDQRKERVLQAVGFPQRLRLRRLVAESLTSERHGGIVRNCQNQTFLGRAEGAAVSSRADMDDAEVLTVSDQGREHPGLGWRNKLLTWLRAGKEAEWLSVFPSAFQKVRIGPGLSVPGASSRDRRP